MNLLALLSLAAVVPAANAAQVVDVAPSSPLPFVLTCAPTPEATATIRGLDLTIRSVHVTFAEGRLEMGLNPNGDELVFAAESAADLVVDEDQIEASWVDQDTTFVARAAGGRRFAAELTYAQDVRVPLSCVKVVTAERDPDEFSLACTPVSEGAATLHDRDLVIRDVLLAYEDREMEMRVNATGDAEIFDLERATRVYVDDRLVSVAWEDQGTSFQASSDDGERFVGALTYAGDSLVPLACRKI